MNIKKIAKIIHEKYPDITVESFNGGVRLTGETDSWKKVVEIGRLAVDKKHSRGVINDVKLKNHTETPMRMPEICDNSLDGETPDVLIIGGGIVGAAILRELSKFDLNLLLIEKEYDLSTGQSGRNDGMLHAGIDLKPKTKKIVYNMRGNRLYDKLSEELDVPIKRNGQYILILSPLQKFLYPFFKIRSFQNKTPLRYAKSKEAEKRMQGLKIKHGAAYCEIAGVISPYSMTVAMAENAVQNGARVSLNTACTDIENDGKRIQCVQTNRGIIYPKIVINAAGVFADKIAEMAGDRFFTIHPRRGTEVVLDKKAAAVTDSVFGMADFKGRSKSRSKGGGIIRTIDGNILVGPTAIETPERECEATAKSEVEALFLRHNMVSDSFKKSDIITYFSGTRAANYEEEFIIEKSPVIENFVQAAAIQSPGVTAAPAIAEDIARFAVEILGKDSEVVKKSNFNPYRKKNKRVAELSDAEREALIKENPDYGIIICRCEEVSKGEIIDAINSPVPCHSIDGIKRRVRSGMGRCQGGFCAPLITEIIAETTGKSIFEVEKKGGGRVLSGKTK